MCAVLPILFIAPYFAPQAAVGAYRSVKLARHLPEHGVRPIVLSGTFAEDRREPELARSLPASVVVADAYLDPRLAEARRAFARLFSAREDARAHGAAAPSRGMDPLGAPLDRYALHALHARRRALELARAHRVAAIYASLGPFSAAEVALSVGAELGIPVVLDFRDPFSLHESTLRANGLAASARRLLLGAVEERWLRRAAHAVFNTEAALAAYRTRHPFLAAKSTCVRNAFDGLEPLQPASAPPPGTLRLLHVGSFRDDAPLDDLARGIALLVKRRGIGPQSLELVHHGTFSAYERALCDRLGIAAFVRLAGPVPHLAVTSVARGAHLLVVPHGPGITLRVPAKTYDYAGSGMPILAISDNPELDALISGHPTSMRVRCGDPEAVAESLERHFDRASSTGALPEPASPPMELGARHAATLLAEVLERTVRGRCGAGCAPSRGAPASASPGSSSFHRGMRDT